MNYFCYLLLGTIFFFEANCATTANLKNDPMFKIFSQNCSGLNEFSNQELELIESTLSECKDWTAITALSSVQKFSSGNEVFTRCYLYYESFISLCNQSLPNFKQIVLSKSNTRKTVEEVCSNLLILPKNNLHLHQFIEDEELCRILCSAYDVGKVSLHKLCEQSYYYNTQVLVNDIASNEEDSLTTSSTQDLKPFINEIEKTLLPQSSPKVSNKNINKSQQVGVELTKGNSSTDINIKSSEKKANPTDSKISSNNPKSVEVPTQELQPVKIDNNEEVGMKELNSGGDSIENKKDNLNNEDFQTDDLVDDQQEKQPTLENDKLVDIDIVNTKNLGDLELDNIKPESPKQEKADEDSVPDRFKRPKTDHQGEPYDFDADMDGNSNFFAYFSFICVIFVIGYIGYHNKQKVLALLLEGRSSRRHSRGRRPNSANYHKLDSNLEEAISSSCRKNSNNVIY